MKITAAKVFVCSPGRNYVTLKLETDAGVFGLGDATLNGREKAVVAYLEEHCLPALLGRDARNIEDIWHLFYRGAYWRRGPVTMTAIAAIDLALWDIKAKALGTPLYNLLGGKSREQVRVYAHATGASLEAAVDAVGEMRDSGFEAVRVQSAVPGVAGAYGVARAGQAYEPAQAGLPQEQRWQTSLYLEHLPKLLERVRSEHGHQFQLLHDVHHRCTPIEAARLAKSVEPFGLAWLEDPVAGELQEGLRLVRQHSTTPIAIGEVFNSVYDYTRLLTEQLIDFVRMPPVHGGGITHLMKVIALAGVYHVRTGFHGATDLSPINFAASLHIDLAINNFGLQEYMPHPPETFEVFGVNYQCESGHCRIDETPGIGVRFDEQAAARYPYAMASLPVNRCMDGTLFHW